MITFFFCILQFQGFFEERINRWIIGVAGGVGLLIILVTLCVVCGVCIYVRHSRRKQKKVKKGEEEAQELLPVTEKGDKTASETATGDMPREQQDK